MADSETQYFLLFFFRADSAIHFSRVAWRTYELLLPDWGGRINIAP